MVLNVWIGRRVTQDVTNTAFVAQVFASEVCVCKVIGWLHNVDVLRIVQSASSTCLQMRHPISSNMRMNALRIQTPFFCCSKSKQNLKEIKFGQNAMFVSGLLIVQCLTFSLFCHDLVLSFSCGCEW